MVKPKISSFSTIICARKFSISTTLLFFAGLTLTVAQSDLITVKKRVVSELMDVPVDDTEIQVLLNTVKEDGTWPEIDYTDVSREGFLHRIHASNMVELSRAYRTKTSKFFENDNVKNTIESALTNWVENDYICDNWWYNQIGIPNTLVSLMLIIGDELPKELVDKAQPIIGRANVNAQGARPGGDRIKIAGIEAKNMLFLNERARFERTVKIIEGEIKKVEWIGMDYGYGYRPDPRGFENRSAGGRGIQYDHSFHHRNDGVNNTLSYGLGYANAFIEWAVFTKGTQYLFSDEKLEELIDYFLDGICKTAIYGKFPDPGAKNRSISREGSLKPYDTTMAEKLHAVSDYRAKELQEIIAIRNESLKPTVSHATFYRHTEHFTFQRPNFFTSVRMHSTRTHNMEYPYNSEGLLNHHRGDGANHISVTGDEYYDIWPVYDYQKIPGTTIVQKPEIPAPKEIRILGITDFVGAVTDGTYGAVAFDFKRQADTLAARKSWFFFDEEYVCLGAGISTDRELPVATTLNQSLLRGEVMISRKNNASPVEMGENTFPNLDWVFHDGIAYIFPTPTTAQIKNTKETGSWWRINRQVDSPTEDISINVFALWLNHGNRAKDAKYEYIIVPNTSMDALKKGAKNRPLSILSNTPYIQAVKNDKLNICQIIFYKAGEIQISDGLILNSDTPGIVMLKMDDDGSINEVSVADPNRELMKMHISLSTRIRKKGEGFKTLWNKSTKTTEIAIDMPNGVDAGKTVTLTW